ncbi:MAG: hypothetical protein HUK19_02270 [Fibrobacter sp.]|nr:hypothetical protein [Fibrobacter sp.]
MKVMIDMYNVCSGARYHAQTTTGGYLYTAPHYGWKTARGAKKWAESNGYEVVSIDERLIGGGVQLFGITEEEFKKLGRDEYRLYTE